MAEPQPGGRAARCLVAALAALALMILPGAPRAWAEATFAPPEQVLQIELNEGELIRLETAASSVFVANPLIADVSVKSDRLVYVFGTGTGETTFYAVDAADEIIASIRVVVNHNVSRLNAALSRLSPAGGINAQSLDGGIVLSGAVDNATLSENARRLATRFLAENEEIINQLAVTSPSQVNLQVKIAEISREVIDQFGFNWEAVFTGSADFLFGIATGLPVIPSTVAATNTVSPGLGDSRVITRTGLELSSGFFRSTKGNFEISSLIDLLAQNDLVTVLAEPNLTAVSGETASFLAGGEFPIPVPQPNGGITIEFKKFGVSLAFTPTLLNENRISMRVRPEVSQLSNTGAIVIDNFQIPSLTTRRAETTVELGSGQSFAIAGLLLDNSRQDHDSIPGLSDIPILGPLFNSERFERNESELVIVVTPYIVAPVDRGERVALPTDPYINHQPSAVERETALSPAVPHTLSIGRAAGAAGTPPSLTGFILE